MIQSQPPSLRCGKKDIAGEHQDGICAIGMEFMQPIDAAKWSIAKTQVYPC